MIKVYVKVLPVLFFLTIFSCGPDQISEGRGDNPMVEEMIIKSPHGKIYKVGNDLKTLTAFQGEDSLWTTDIGKVLDTTVPGKNEIRNIKLTQTGILVLFGKHCYILVDSAHGFIKDKECD